MLRKTIVAVVLVALGLAGLALARGAAAARQETVFDRVTAEDVQAVLKDLSLESKKSLTRSGDSLLQIDFGQFSAWLIFYGCDSGPDCTDLTFYTYFDTKGATPLARVNRWNLESRFSRAYLDEDGFPTIETDLDLAGGVTRDALRTWIDGYRESVSDFAAFLAPQR